MDQRGNHEGNYKKLRDEWKRKHNVPELRGHCKSGVKWEIYEL